MIPKPSLKIFELNLHAANKHMTIYDLGSLMGLHPNHIEKIVTQQIKDEERLLITWHHWQMFVKAFDRVDKDLLEKVLKIYG